jgi:hypothetical protein
MWINCVAVPTGQQLIRTLTNEYNRSSLAGLTPSENHSKWVQKSAIIPGQNQPKAAKKAHLGAKLTAFHVYSWSQFPLVALVSSFLRRQTPELHLFALSLHSLCSSCSFGAITRAIFNVSEPVGCHSERSEAKSKNPWWR